MKEMKVINQMEEYVVVNLTSRAVEVNGRPNKEPMN